LLDTSWSRPDHVRGEGLGDVPRLICWLRRGVEPFDGPGLGIEVDETLFEKYPGIPGPCYVW